MKVRLVKVSMLNVCLLTVFVGVLRVSLLRVRRIGVVYSVIFSIRLILSLLYCL